jgi:hypothetical protein
MDKHDIETIVHRVQNGAFSPRTVADHLTVVKTFWKWLEGKDEIYPEKVAWIKARYNNKKIVLPEELLTNEDIDTLERCLARCRSDSEREMVSAELARYRTILRKLRSKKSAKVYRTPGTAHTTYTKAEYTVRLQDVCRKDAVTTLTNNQQGGACC